MGGGGGRGAFQCGMGGRLQAQVGALGPRQGSRPLGSDFGKLSKGP